MLSVVRRRSTTFRPSGMRFISRWVTGVPLPGWMFSAVMTTKSLPSFSMTLPLRTELAMTETTKDLWIGVKMGANSSPAPPWKAHDRLPAGKPMVGFPPPRRPPRAALAAKPDKGGNPSPFRGPGLHRGRVRRPCRLARQRGASACLRDDGADHGRRAAPALSPHLARIRRQEAARRRRDEDLRFRPGLSEPRARRAACAGVHQARM